AVCPANAVRDRSAWPHPFLCRVGRHFCAGPIVISHRAMKTPVAAIGFALVSPLLIAAEVRATCEHTFETKLKPGSDLRMLLRPGDIQITGSNTDILKVTCELEDAGRARDVLISFRPEGHT